MRVRASSSDPLTRTCEQEDPQHEREGEASPRATVAGKEGESVPCRPVALELAGLPRAAFETDSQVGEHIQVQLCTRFEGAGARDHVGGDVGGGTKTCEGGRAGCQLHFLRPERRLATNMTADHTGRSEDIRTPSGWRSRHERGRCRVRDHDGCWRARAEVGSRLRHPSSITLIGRRFHPPLPVLLHLQKERSYLGEQALEQYIWVVTQQEERSPTRHSSSLEPYPTPKTPG